MKTKSYAILILAALSFAACKKNPGTDSNPVVAQGQDTKLTLKITRASGLTTYSPGTNTGTPDEQAIKTIDVFIFDAGTPFGLMTTHIDNPTVNTDGTVSLTGINAKTGLKKVYVGINLSANIVNKIKENYANLTDGIEVSLGDLVDLVDVTAQGTSSLAMFNDIEPTALTIVPELGVPNTNVFSVAVSRLVAKVVVKTDENLSLQVPGGTLSDLEFTSGQTNKKLHIAPLVDFKDLNWAEAYGNDFNLVDINTYKGINLDNGSDDILTANSIYMQENTSQQYRNNEVSYVSIKAKFTPTTITGTTTDGTFFAVFTTTGVHYFGNQVDAFNSIPQQGGSQLQGNPVQTYTNGFCYYRLYLNAPGQYNVLRNVLYKANITKINNIGTTNPDQIAGAPDTPENTTGEEGVDPTNLPINPATNLSIEGTVTIQPWSVNYSDYEF